MNSQPNLITKLQRLFLIAALAISPFIAFQSGMAQVTTATLTTTGGLTNVSITGNGSFTMTLGVTTNYVSSGYTVFYTSPDSNGLFQLVSRVNNLPLFNDPTTSDGVAFGGTGGVLNPTNDFDLGYTGDQVNNQAAGTFALQTLTINALNAAPGVYHIVLDPRSVMTDRTGGGFNDAPMFGGVNGPNPSFTINVIPEPATIGLAVMGGAMLLVVARRKFASRA